MSKKCDSPFKDSFPSGKKNYFESLAPPILPSLHHEPGSNHVYGVAGEAGGESGQYTRSQVTAGALRNKLCPRLDIPALLSCPCPNHVYGVTGEAQFGQYTRCQVTAGTLRNQLCPTCKINKYLTATITMDNWFMTRLKPAGCWDKPCPFLGTFLLLLGMPYERGQYITYY